MGFFHWSKEFLSQFLSLKIGPIEFGFSTMHHMNDKSKVFDWRKRVKFPLYPLFKRHIEFELERLEDFVYHSRSSMKQAWKRFEGKFDADTAGWNEEQIYNYADALHDQMVALRDTSPQLLTRSQCLIVFGSVEHLAARLCGLLHKDMALKTDKPSYDLSWFKSRRFFDRVLIARPKPCADEWEWLNELRVIRNWIAHSGSRPVRRDGEKDEEWDRGQRFLKRNRGLIKLEQRNVVLQDALIDRVLVKSKQAFARLLKAIDGHYRRAQKLADASEAIAR